LYPMNLLKPPHSSYSKICNDYEDEIAKLMSTTTFSLIHISHSFLARNLLRTILSEEYTEKIRGIAKDNEVPLHTVVAYNTYLLGPVR
ncbi:hypothetical protein CPB84DRAFT_1686369, partial [Gymnopilus junonius]